MVQAHSGTLSQALVIFVALTESSHVCSSTNGCFAKKGGGNMATCAVNARETILPQTVTAGNSQTPIISTPTSASNFNKQTTSSHPQYQGNTGAGRGFPPRRGQEVGAGLSVTPVRVDRLAMYLKNYSPATRSHLLKGFQVGL